MAAGLNFSVELVPGHTSGQVVYRLHVSPDSPDCLFTGDFLFVGGTGKLFEGNDARLLSSLLAVKSWQPNSLIFPSHEFAKENLEFALTIEPDNVELSSKYVDVCDLRLARLPAMPTTLEDEFEYNPFLRLGKESLVKGLENLGYVIPPAKTHKGRTRLDSDVVDFNRKAQILRILRKAKEDYDAKKSKKSASQNCLQRA
uniref:HAGH_C domain-containing protein n=1 Tax=Syphacia muris TaxID=451379 RepID=A0A158R6A0_9BILA